MSHYEERLQADLDQIRNRLAAVAQQVSKAQRDAVRALLTGDRALASRTILGDLPINRAVRRIDKACHVFVVRHLPSAGHLRFISAVMRLTIELERIGDYAGTICREAVQLEKPPPPVVARDIELLAEQSQRLLGQAFEAWDQGNAELARGTLGMAGQARDTFGKVIRDLVQAGETSDHSIADLLALQVVLHRLGRVTDQAKNICEETLFAVAGEEKSPKFWRILFVDAKDDGVGRLAAVYANKAYEEIGRFKSAGWDPGESLDPRYARFMEQRGLVPSHHVPRSLEQLPQGLGSYHVVVSLGADPHRRLEEIPFHTVALEWEAPPDLEGLDAERAEALIAESFHRLSLEIRDLMGLLRGEEAV
jgi:phosphate transport system protein